MANIKQALRTQADPLELETVSITDIAQETGAVDVRMVKHAATGNSYVHFVNADGEYLSVKVGAKANVTATDVEGKLKQLITNNVIYTGENENGQWFTFGRVASTTPTKVVSLASLLKKPVLNGAK